MWIAEAEALELERVGAHAQLAAEATESLRGLTGEHLEIAFEDGLWMHRAGRLWFPDGPRFDYPDGCWAKWSDREAKFRRDAADYWFHVYKPKPGDVIVDIGAGHGEDTFAFSEAVGATGTVWAIEAHPGSFRLLERFCLKNGLSNVRLLNCAAMDRRGTLQIQTLPVWESNFVYEGPATPASHAVDAFRFDEICQRHGIDRIDFLKMNIEGAERFALPGMPNALLLARFACISAHDFRAARGEGDEFKTHDFVLKMLQNAGFSLVLRSDDPRYYVKEHIHGFRP
ncbi:MAG: FkbM family methyltransferase [Bryobacteraceae bacterium]|nr:FkbM family methyltransferase [Bryobacteraceae bacterium]